MINSYYLHPVNFLELSSNSGYPREVEVIHIKYEAGSVLSHADQNFGVDGVELPDKVWRTRFHFFRLRVPIVGWSALEDVGDVNIISAEVQNTFDHLGEQFSSSTHKWSSLQILFLSRGFTHKNGFRVGIAFSRDVIRVGFP